MCSSSGSGYRGTRMRCNTIYIACVQSFGIRTANSSYVWICTRANDGVQEGIEGLEEWGLNLFIEDFRVMVYSL